MSGVKGRSGRRPMSDEQRKYKTIDLAWAIVNKGLGKKSTLSLDKKMILAKDVVLKDITARLDNKGLISKDTKIIIIRQPNGIEPMTKQFEVRSYSELPDARLKGAPGEGTGGPQGERGPHTHTTTDRISPEVPNNNSNNDSEDPNTKPTEDPIGAQEGPEGAQYTPEFEPEDPIEAQIPDEPPPQEGP